MSDAEKAYEAARAAIARARAEDATELVLDREECRALDRLPPEIAEFGALTQLDLVNTEVRDLTPLAGLTGLQLLRLNQTAVQDLTPLAGLTGLQTLWLNRTAVQDLRPIRDLPQLGEVRVGGLGFRGTPAVARDAELRRLSEIGDSRERTRETLAYLKTLPPWPEPLPWEVEAPAAMVDGVKFPEPPVTKKDGDGDSDDSFADDDIPAQVPAPLQVEERDGVLHAVPPGVALDGVARSHARQGWAALRDFLDDMGDLRGRIDNSLPQAARALRRFDAAMGQEFEALNQIAAGMHGGRLIALVEAAREVLGEADAAEFAELAGSIAVFRERFEEWRVYRDSAAVSDVAPEAVQEALQALAEVSEDLKDAPEIDHQIPAILDDQIEAAQDAPTDRAVAFGLVTSLRNALAGLAPWALRGWRLCREAGRQLAGETWNEARKLIAKGLVATALDILVLKGAVLHKLAAVFPNQLGWVRSLLNAIGL